MSTPFVWALEKRTAIAFENKKTCSPEPHKNEVLLVYAAVPPIVASLSRGMLVSMGCRLTSWDSWGRWGPMRVVSAAAQIIASLPSVGYFEFHASRFLPLSNAGSSLLP